jgi:hypothetical protein
MHLKNHRKLYEELNSILEKLLFDIDTYYSKDLVLNSEGMKLLSRAIRIINTLYPQLRFLINEVRADPTYNVIIKLVSRIKELIEPS